jgi:hypothetical protein
MLRRTRERRANNLLLLVLFEQFDWHVNRSCWFVMVSRRDSRYEQHGVRVRLRRMRRGFGTFFCAKRENELTYFKSLGMSAWLTLGAPQAPNLPPTGYSVVPGGTNDLDCNLACNNVCSVTFQYVDSSCNKRCKAIEVYAGTASAKVWIKEVVLCDGDCLTLEEAQGTSVWLHVDEHRLQGENCGRAGKSVFEIADICSCASINDPNDEIVLIDASGPKCGLPCPQSFLGP